MTATAIGGSDTAAIEGRAPGETVAGLKRFSRGESVEVLFQ